MVVFVFVKQGGADFGAGGPGLEFFNQFIGGLLAFALLFGGEDGVFLGNKVAAAILDKGLVDAEDGVELRLDRFGDLGVEGHFGEQRAVAGADGGGEGIQEGAAGGGAEVGGFGGEVFGGFAHFLAGEPFAVAAEVPVGEIWGEIRLPP